MKEMTKMKEIVQYKSEDISVYRRAKSKADGSGSSVDDVWRDDICGLEMDLAKDLIDMVVEQEKPMTICLDGRWGSGKTFFLTRIVETYKSQGGTALYYNAWEDDFLDDPLISIISQFKDKNIPDKIYGTIKKAAKPILAEMGWSFTKKIVGQITKNKLGLDISDLSIGDADAIAGRDAVDAYNEMDKSRKALKHSIEVLAEKNWEKKLRPLLFVIDEIDRCRPTFAVEVLERVKHLFSVDHMVFLVGADKVQLMESIRSVYGNIDAQDYLNRFFDLDLHLSEVPRETFVNRIWSHLQYEKIMPTENSGEWRECLEIFKELVQTSGLSLRQIEHCVRLLPFVKNQIRDRQRGQLSLHCLPLLVGGVILKVKDDSLFQDLLKEKLPIHRLLNVLFQDCGRGWPLPHSEYVTKVLYGAFYEFEDQKHSILTLARKLNTRGHIGVNDLGIENATGELPTFMNSWSDDEIKKFYHDVSGFIVDKDRINKGVMNPNLTLQVLQYALMLA